LPGSLECMLSKCISVSSTLIHAACAPRQTDQRRVSACTTTGEATLTLGCKCTHKKSEILPETMQNSNKQYCYNASLHPYACALASPRCTTTSQHLDRWTTLSVAKHPVHRWPPPFHQTAAATTPV
jgi:hypothetical protein